MIAFTRILYDTSSAAKLLVNPKTAALDVAQATSPGSATIGPVTLDKFTMAPLVDFFKSGKNILVTFHVPLIFISK